MLLMKIAGDNMTPPPVEPPADERARLEPEEFEELDGQLHSRIRKKLKEWDREQINGESEEDIAQTAWLRVWNKDIFWQADSRIAYLWRTAHNHMKNLLGAEERHEEIPKRNWGKILVSGTGIRVADVWDSFAIMLGVEADADSAQRFAMRPFSKMRSQRASEAVEELSASPLVQADEERSKSLAIDQVVGVWPMPGLAISPERIVAAREFLEHVLASVDPETRDLLVEWARGDGFAAIAKRHGLDVRGVRNRVDKARLQIDQIFSAKVALAA